MNDNNPVAAAPYHVLRISQSLGQRVRAHVLAVKAAGGVETITHFVATAIEDALAKFEGSRS